MREWFEFLACINAFGLPHSAVYFSEGNVLDVPELSIQGSQGKHIGTEEVQFCRSLMLFMARTSNGSHQRTNSLPPSLT